MALQITVRGGANAKANLRKLNAKLSDLREALRTMHGEYRKIMTETFAAEGTPIQWPALEKRYAAFKARKRPGRKILVYNGLLRRSFLGREDSAITRKIVTKKYGIFGSKVPYSGYHQTGTRKMKSRPIIQLFPNNRRRLTLSAMSWVRAELKKIYGSKGIKRA